MRILAEPLFVTLAWLGLRQSAIWLAIGWAVHPAWGAFLHMRGPGATFAPAWYVVACISFDILVAAFILFKRHEL